MRLPAYRYYLLAVLVLVQATNNMERQVFGLVLQSIKIDFDLSDTELGLLGGIAFSLFYTIMGVPIARWADRGNRVNIIAATTVLWGIAVSGCAAATNFVQLMLIRIGVATGEAGCIPPAHSLLADYFVRAERPRALSLYTLGGPIAVLIGYTAGGWLNQLYGWRSAFLAIGATGLPLSILTFLSLKDPRRMRQSPTRPIAAPSGASPSVIEVLTALWSRRTYRHLLFAFSVTSFFFFGIAQWHAAFFIRSFGMSTGELGTWFALIYGFGASFGMWAGGFAASKYARNNESLQLSAMAGLYIGFGIFSALTYVAPNKLWALTFAAVATIGVSAAPGPLFAIIQTLVPGRMRAQSVALLYFFSNLIGLGFGPLAAGMLSDSMKPYFGESALRYALFALSSGFCWAAWHLWQASKTVSCDLSSLVDDRSADDGDEASVAEPR